MHIHSIESFFFLVIIGIKSLIGTGIIDYPVRNDIIREYSAEKYPSFSHLILAVTTNTGFDTAAEKLSTLDTLYVFFSGYHGYIKSVCSSNKYMFLLMKNDTLIAVDDFLIKDYYDTHKFPDLEDTIRNKYPAFTPLTEPGINVEPGRIRNYQLIKSVYGSNRENVEKNLVCVNFCGQNIKFNRQNGAAAALKRVSRELSELIIHEPEIGKLLTNRIGTYNPRKILFTENYSMHSFGIAIDINLKKPYYWPQFGVGTSPLDSRLAKVPGVIVTVFERHGFIWGGRWYHYDKIHFEYRPEFFHRMD